MKVNKKKDALFVLALLPLALLAAMMTAILLSSCDAHRDFPDTSVKAGDILCTDGQVMTYEQYQTSSKKAIAVVFYVNQNPDIEGYGYAVYLWDTQPLAFADSTGTAQGTSCDVRAYDGNANTFAMFDSTVNPSPLAETVFDLWRYGQSAYIGSVGQMRLLYWARDAVNPYIEKCGGVPIPTDEDGDCWYWTSTEVAGQSTAKAWLYSLGSGAVQETPKLQEHKARPIITLND